MRCYKMCLLYELYDDQQVGQRIQGLSNTD